MVRASGRNDRAQTARKGPGGASKKDKSNEVSPLVLFLKGAVKYILALSAVGGVFAVIFLFSPKEKLEQFAHNPINAVLIEGTFNFFSRTEAERVISDQVAGSFIDLDIEKIKKSLEQNPWVDSVSITREWPDKLIIKIIEQQAIARWGEKNFLNIRGDIISVKNVDKMGELPFLNGNDSYAKDVMKQYLKMGKLLSQYGLKLKSVELDETLSWSLIIGQNVKVKLGRDQIWGKLQNLMEAKKGLLGEKFSKIDQVDMRYSSGFAIAWKKIKNSQYVAEG